MKLLNFCILLFLGFNTSCGFIEGLMGPSSSDESIVYAGSSEIKIVASDKKFKFIPDQIFAKPGQVLKIKVVNQLDDLPLVFSILKKDEDPIVNAFLGIQSGESNSWSPPEEQILVKLKTLVSSQSESLSIKMPSEPGEYAFISSYPGQIDAFNGVIKVVDPKEVVSNDSE